jgi:hypothetical protein
LTPASAATSRYTAAFRPGDDPRGSVPRRLLAITASSRGTLGSTCQHGPQDRAWLGLADMAGNGPAAYLADHRLIGYIRAIRARDDHDPDRMKPDPYSVRAAVGIVDADNHECALIGDTTADVFAGLLAGVPVIGYANKPGNAQTLAEVQAAAITDDLSDITHALREDLPVTGRTDAPMSNQALSMLAGRRLALWCRGAAVPRHRQCREFIRLRTGDNHEDRERSAWAAMPGSVWRELLSDHPEMHFWLAHNRTTPLDIMTELAQDPDWRVRHRVARKRVCPSDLLDALGRDPHDAVRSTAARTRALQKRPC